MAFQHNCCFIEVVSGQVSPDSIRQLANLRDYAFAQKTKGGALLPPGVKVQLSVDGTVINVKEENVRVSGNVFECCGVIWDGGWYFSGAGDKTYSDNAPAWASGGGDEPFVLHGTITGETDGTVQESVADLVAAITAGKRVVFHLEPVEDLCINVEMVHCSINEGNPYCVGSFADDTLVCYVVGVSGDALVFEVYSYTLTPAT